MRTDWRPDDQGPWFVYRTTSGECLVSLWEIRAEREDWIEAGPAEVFSLTTDDPDEVRVNQDVYALVCGDEHLASGVKVCAAPSR